MYLTDGYSIFKKGDLARLQLKSLPTCVNDHLIHVYSIGRQNIDWQSVKMLIIWHINWSWILMFSPLESRGISFCHKCKNPEESNF